jgi:hypothetical protein
MGDKFGDNPTVSAKITVKHKEAVLDNTHIEQGHVAWYNVVSETADEPRLRIQNTSTEAGYQSSR